VRIQTCGFFGGSIFRLHGWVPAGQPQAGTARESKPRTPIITAFFFAAPLAYPGPARVSVQEVCPKNRVRNPPKKDPVSQTLIRLFVHRLVRGSASSSRCDLVKKSLPPAPDQRPFRRRGRGKGKETKKKNRKKEKGGGNLFYHSSTPAGCGQRPSRSPKPRGWRWSRRLGVRAPDVGLSVSAANGHALPFSFGPPRRPPPRPGGLG